MENDKLQALSRRIAVLPEAQRTLLLERLRVAGIDFAMLPITPSPRAGGRCSASSAQSRLWFLWRLDPRSAAYNMSVGLRLRGALDLAGLQAAFDQLIARHESLRTTFHESEADGVAQQVHAPRPLRLGVRDLCAFAVHERQPQLESVWEEEASTPFDLEAGPLLRASVIATADEEHVLLLTAHHIVSDGWSMNIVLEELAALYDARLRGRRHGLRELAIQYADYALWQRTWMAAGEAERQLGYWRTKLGAQQAVGALPSDRPRPKVRSYRGGECCFELSEDLTVTLKALAKQHDATLGMVLLASLKLLLHRYTGELDLRVGMTVANRNRLETEGLIGFFVNTLVMRTDASGNPPFTAFLSRVRSAVLDGQEHQDLPFERLVEELKPERSLSHQPLFQVMCNHQVGSFGSERTFAGLRADLLSRSASAKRFDLSLDTTDTGAAISGALSYAGDMFDAATIDRMVRHFRTLLESLARSPLQRIGELAMLSAAEQQAVRGWNDTHWAASQGASVHRLFEAQVERTPAATALAFGEQRLSYRALNARANQLAQRLRSAGVGREVLVGLYAHRSCELIVAMLAVLKAGGAYLPLDPDYPLGRLRYMLDDSGIRLVLAGEELAAALAGTGLTVWPLRSVGELSEDRDTNLPDPVHPDALAYCIYTSGSTGRPKGVANPQRGIANRLLWLQRDHPLGSDDRVLQKTPVGFDVSVAEIFGPLIAGAVLVIAPPALHREPAKLGDLIRRERITSVHFVPSMLRSFAAAGELGACPSLRRIVCSGEALTKDIELAVFGHHQARLYNLYGPTEAAVEVTCWECQRGDLTATVPIGRPIANATCYVLDRYLNPAPVGAAGELYLGGVALARGYLRRPGLSAERFVPDPFVGRGARMYRTGDFARARADGTLECLGRVDGQVKIRGFRIELGEVAARLREHQAVRDAAVVVRQTAAGDRLVGYVVAAECLAGGLAERLDACLRAHLRVTLPEYMVPAQLVFLEALPLTASGKVDTQALPAFQAVRSSYVAPRNGLEASVAALFQDLLHVERVGISDDFFELGGHSLLAAQLASELARLFARPVPLATVFEARTIKGIADALMTSHPLAGAEGASLIEAGGARRPLFCIHDGLGYVAGYRRLAKALRGERPVYGISSRFFSRPDWIDESIEDMADHYAQTIAARVRDARVNLLGWSSGGRLAIETARRLQARGFELGVLGVVDDVFLLEGTRAAPGAATGRELAPNGGFDGRTRRRFEQWLKASHFPGHWRRFVEVCGAELSTELWRRLEARGDTQRTLDAMEEHVLLRDAQYELLMRRFQWRAAPVRLHAWWAAESLAARGLSGAAPPLRPGLIAESRILKTDHYRIIQHPELHAELRELLLASDRLAAGKSQLRAGAGE